MSANGSQDSENASTLEACELFFKTCPPPEDLCDVRERAKLFVEKQQRGGRLLALVTSGGTTVPLEKNTVRFIDNFSSGGRGSKSAEYFLENGYSVIFLHRGSSLQPFRRHLANHNPLDWLSVSEDLGEIQYSGTPSLKDQLLNTLHSYQKCKKEQTLLSIPFTTLFQYLHYLRELALLLQPLGHRAVVYLAAAVSDFYIPHAKLATHKIQSSGQLELDFSHTPKMVLPLTTEWAPQAFVVTFKLETDEAVLLPHAKKALLKYGHQVVVANLLASYCSAVTIVTRCANDKEEGVAGESLWNALELRLSRDEISKGTELESLIISDLVVRHQKHLP